MIIVWLKRVAGNPFPTLMTGMTNTLNYKGIDFSLLFRENGALAYTIQQESIRSC
jgi:hypothetical protein